MTEGVPAPGTWSTHETKHFRLLHHPDGLAGRDMAAIAGRLEVFRSGFHQALGRPPVAGPPTSIALSDPSDPADEPPPPDVDLLATYRSDAPGKGLEVPLVRIWLERLVQPESPTPDFLIDGITGYVDEETHELDRSRVGGTILSERAAGRTISPSGFLDRPDEGNALYFLVATSFVDFLLRAFGSGRLLEFLGQLDPARPDRATEAVYGASMADLERAWALSLEEARPPARGLLPLLAEFVRRTGPYLWPASTILAVMLVQVVLAVSIPFLEKEIFDDALNHGDAKLLFGLLGFLAFGFFLKSAAGLYQDLMAARIGTRAMNGLRHEMFARLHHLSMDYFSRTGPGEITSRFSGDLPVVEQAMIRSFPWGIYYLATFVVSAVLLFTIDWRLALLTTVTSPLIDVAIRTIGPRAARAAYASKQVDARITGQVAETIAAQRVIKIFGLEEAILGRFDRILDDRVRAAVRASFLSHLAGRLSLLSLVFVEILVIGIGSYFVLRNWLTIGSLIAFASLLLNMAFASNGLGEFLPQMLQATGAYQRIKEFQTETPTFGDRPRARPLERMNEGIRFRDVSFSYTGERIDLEDVELEISAGSSVAFVGPTGSGKSTILSLMTRLYDPLSGSIEIDGTDLRDVTLASLRHQIGVVFQDVFLFDDSIRENIRAGRPAATDEEVEDAARAAEVHAQILRLPGGYDATIGTRGTRLSGGQRQRISIARALLRDPAILILDEATSALDASTERAIGATLRRLTADRTVVTVTHRLASVVDCDRLFVLDDGRLVEQGTHEELRDAKGLYERLWTEQSGFQVSADGRRATISPGRLARLPLLKNLAPDALTRIANRFTSEVFEIGQEVCSEGEPGDKFYFIVRGAVEVVHRLPTGLEKRLAVRRDGDHFGEVALLRSTSRTATVRTLTETLLVSLDREQFENLLDLEPGIRTALENEIAARGPAGEDETEAD